MFLSAIRPRRERERERRERGRKYLTFRCSYIYSSMNGVKCPPPPPFLAVGSITSIFIFVIYSKSNSCQSQIKNSKFTTGRKQLLLHLQQDHSKILKTCHPALCSPTSAAICFLLKHYTKKRCYFHAFRSAQESETDSVKTSWCA